MPPTPLPTVRVPAPRRAAAALLVLALALVGLLPSAAAASTDRVVTRTAGADRIQTAIEASQDFRSSASDAILATAFSFPDALAAGALAHALDAPVLLTPADQLLQRVVDELRRLHVNRVWLLGGHAAISPRVEEALDGLGFAVRRLAGEDRYATAGAIAQAAGPSRTGEVVLALGEHSDVDRAWPDAVASGSLAASPDRVPTVLTRPDALPAPTEAALAALGTTQVVVLGGEATIHPAVIDRLEELGYATRRVVAESRYDTSVQLAADAMARFGDGARPAVFASGRAFPDALAAGSLAASLGAPLVLVPPTDALPSTVDAFLRDHADRLQSGVMVGGTAAADDHVVQQLDAALRGVTAPPTTSPPTTSSAPPPDDAAGDEQGGDAGDQGDAAAGDSFTGTASWYGPGLEGNDTASGEPFDPSQLTAAHRTLPFGTILRVTNLGNGAVVEVRVNDRGPFHESRVLDVSEAAADALGMKADGVAEIRADVLSTGG